MTFQTPLVFFSSNSNNMTFQNHLTFFSSNSNRIRLAAGAAGVGIGNLIKIPKRNMLSSIAKKIQDKISYTYINKREFAYWTQHNNKEHPIAQNHPILTRTHCAHCIPGTVCICYNNNNQKNNSLKHEELFNASHGKTQNSNPNISENSEEISSTDELGGKNMRAFRFNSPREISKDEFNRTLNKNSTKYLKDSGADEKLEKIIHEETK